MKMEILEYPMTSITELITPFSSGRYIPSYAMKSILYSKYSCKKITPR